MTYIRRLGCIELREPHTLPTAISILFDPFTAHILYPHFPPLKHLTKLQNTNDLGRRMSNISPIFPIPDSQQFSDYGFDPKVHYFQVMEEARKHKRETSTKSSINGIQFKLQKPISKDDPTRSTMHNKRKKRWWKRALPFFKWRKWPTSTVSLNEDRRARNFRNLTCSMSGPVYATESRSGSNTPYRTTTTSRPSSGPIAGTLTPARKDDVAVPYLSLRELNMEQEQRISTSSLPIYLVT